MDSFNPDRIHKETKEKAKYVYDIFKLTEEEKEALRARVLESKGLARIMVHPYYIAQKRMHDPDVLQHYDLNRVGIVENGFKRILETGSNTPVVLFEAHGMVSHTVGKINKFLEKSKNSIYLVPTYPDNPRPYFPNYRYSGEEWHKLIELLKDLGIKKLIIGGMLLHNVYNQDSLMGCVGTTVNKLSDDFEVQVSSISSPESRKDVKYPDSKPNQ